MKKILGGVLLAIGAFLLVAALLGTFWAPGVVKKTPIDVNTTTLLSGEAARLDGTTGEFTKKPIYARSVSKVDSDRSTDDVDLFVATSCAVFGTDPDRGCVDGDDPNLITADVDTFATDRVSGMAVDSKLLPETYVRHEGLINKWPFDAEKKTYPFWDGTSFQSVDAVYDRTEKIDGLETYVYEVSIEQAPILIGALGDGTYTDAKTIYVDPRTGAIVNQVDDQQRYLPDGTQVLDLQVGFTDEQVAFNVKDTKANIASLDLVTKVIPLVGFIGGILLLLVGGFLAFREQRRQGGTAPATHKEPVGAGR